jgi:alpha-D-glucose phosphate-specific phosphoglucomutase
MAVYSKPSTLHDISFGTDGWRALIAKEFTYANLEIFSNGLAKYILENYGEKNGNVKPLIIGYDARFLADKFANFTAEIINSYGIEVHMIDHPVPTPVIAYEAFKKETAGALTFTASHNPPEYMGIKYIPEYGGPASKEITEKLLAKINWAAQNQDYKPDAKKASIKIVDPAPDYFEHIRSLVDFDAIKKANAKKQTKLVYDPLYGCGRNYTNKILIEAGFDVTTLHDVSDPTFGGSMPDPSEKILGELKAKILELGADLGAANDGDADRFSFFDNEGTFYPANKSLSIIAKYLIEHRGFKGTIARTLATSHIFDELAKKTGNKSVETAVGFKWICEVMRHEDTIIGAEESGGMSILGHIPEKDGILAILLLAEVLAITGKTPQTLWQEVQDFVGKNYFYDRLDLHVKDKDAFMAKFNDQSLKEIAGFKVTKIDRTEGAKVYLDNGAWFLARASGTEAMCRVYFEANDLKELNSIVKAIETMI